MASSLELFRWFGFIEMGLPYCVALALVSSGVSWLRAGRARTLALPDVVLNLSCALMYLIFRQLLARVAFYPYVTVYYTYALIDDTVMYETMASWLAVHSATFLAVDFTYYCFHRLLHRMHLLWAAHALRHSSATVNAFSAFRLSCIEDVVSWMFYVPWALVIPPPVLVLHVHLNAFYQFALNCFEIRSLGAPLNAVLHTPAHHRMHYSHQVAQRNTHFGGVLSLWDRLFGTFDPVQAHAYHEPHQHQHEHEQCQPFAGVTFDTTFNPIKLSFSRFVALATEAARTSTSLVALLKLVFGVPAENDLLHWAAQQHHAPEPHAKQPALSPHQRQLSLIGSMYLVIQFAAVSWFTYSYLRLVYDPLFGFSSLYAAYLSAFVLYSLYCFGTFLDQQANAIRLECVRLAWLYLVAVDYLARHLCVVPLSDVSFRSAVVAPPSLLALCTTGVSLAFVLLYRHFFFLADKADLPAPKIAAIPTATPVQPPPLEPQEQQRPTPPASPHWDTGAMVPGDTELHAQLASSLATEARLTRSPSAGQARGMNAQRSSSSSSSATHSPSSSRSSSTCSSPTRSTPPHSPSLTPQTASTSPAALSPSTEVPLPELPDPTASAVFEPAEETMRRAATSSSVVGEARPKRRLAARAATTVTQQTATVVRASPRLKEQPRVDYKRLEKDGFAALGRRSSDLGYDKHA